MCQLRATLHKLLDHRWLVFTKTPGSPSHRRPPPPIFCKGWRHPITFCGLGFHDNKLIDSLLRPRNGVSGFFTHPAAPLTKGRATVPRYVRHRAVERWVVPQTSADWVKAAHEIGEQTFATRRCELPTGRSKSTYKQLLLMLREDRDLVFGVARTPPLPRWSNW